MLALALTLTAAMAPALTVAEARTMLPTAEGREAVVRGRVSKVCEPRSCALEGETGTARLSLAGATAIEPRLRKARGKVVTLRVRFGKPAFRTEGGNVIVTADRAQELIPLEMMTVR